MIQSCPKPSVKKKKKVKKTTLAKMRKILDRLWFETIYLRDKGTCQKCGRKDTLSAHHVFGKKAYPAGRWNIDNGILLCYADHIFFAHGKPYDFQSWIINFKGRTYTEGLSWWDKLFVYALQKLQFRAHDFDRIKGELEYEQEKIKRSQTMAGNVDMPKWVSHSTKI